MTNTNDSAPYIVFGATLYRLREARNIRTEEMAACIAKTAEEYKKQGMTDGQIKEQVAKDVRSYKEIEYGRRLPTDVELQKIAKRLDLPLATLKDMRLQAKRKIGVEEPEEISGAITLSPDLEKSWKRVQSAYKDQTKSDLTTTQLTLFGLLKQELYRIFLPAPLPFETVIILDTLRRYRKRVRYLREITDFVCKGEPFTGYLARHVWGGYLTYLANLYLFQSDPSPNFLHCMNRLEIAQANEFFAMGFYDSPVYSVAEQLPVLQKYNDFTTIAAMTARGFRSILPKEINSDHLEMAVTLQGAGQNILCTSLYPPLCIGGEEDPDGVNNKKLYKIICYEMPADVSAMCAAAWRCPWEVIEAIQTRRDLPANNVSPFCATLKMVNVFANTLLDPDLWSVISVNLVGQYMERYPQLKSIPAKDIFGVLQNMHQMKEQFFERSSTLAVSGKKPQAAMVEKIMSMEKKPVFDELSAADKKSSDIRLEQNFLKSLCAPAIELANNLVKEETAPRKLENINDFGNRVKLFHLRRAYAKRRDAQVIAHDSGITEQELTALLKI